MANVSVIEVVLKLLESPLDYKPEDAPSPDEVIAALENKIQRVTKILHSNYKGHCCQINCNEEAEWEIYAKGVPDTASCTKHIGELLTDAVEHRIFRID